MNPDKNIELCRKLFEKMCREDDDFATIVDYFSLKTLQLLEDHDVDVAERYCNLFRKFSGTLSKTKLNRFEGFFYALSNLLENRWYFMEAMNNEKGVIEYLKRLKKVIEDEVDENGSDEK